jgi:transposase
MNAYSKDLRLKVLCAIDRGIPRKEVADLFGVSLSTIKRWLRIGGASQGTSTSTRSPADPRSRARL